MAITAKPVNGETGWGTTLNAHLDSLKEYVDEQIAANVPDTDAFTSYTDKDSSGSALAEGEVYKAQCDGFVTARCASGIRGISDAFNPPTTVILNSIGASGFQNGFTLPVSKDEYFKVSYISGSAALTMYWKGIGSTLKPVKQ